MPDPVCPACGAALAKAPQRKTKCKACGEFMFVRSTPDNRTRRAMTAAQAAEAEAMWGGYGQRAMESADSANFGVIALDYEGPVDLPDSAKAMERAHQLAKVGPQFKLAVMGMYRSSKDSTEALAALWALMLIDMQGCTPMAYTVQLRAHGGRECARCKGLDMMVVSSDAPVDQLLPADCPQIMQPLARRRALCNVTVSAWIKRPDGTNYLDRKPTPARPPMSPTELEQARQAWSETLGIALLSPARSGISAANLDELQAASANPTTDKAEPAAPTRLFSSARFAPAERAAAQHRPAAQWLWWLRLLGLLRR